MKKEKINPSDFRARCLSGSDLGDQEKEAVAKTIIDMSRKRQDEWFNFRLLDYLEFLESCETRPRLQNEEAILNALVYEDGILDKNGEHYSVNDLFFDVLAPFINPYDTTAPQATIVIITIP